MEAKHRISHILGHLRPNSAAETGSFTHSTIATMTYLSPDVDSSLLRSSKTCSTGKCNIDINVPLHRNGKLGLKRALHGGDMDFFGMETTEKEVKHDHIRNNQLSSD